MKKFTTKPLAAALLTALLAAPGGAWAVANVQCPEDQDGDGIPAADLDGNVLDADDTDVPNVHCIHLSAGDGFAQMADGRELYLFSYSDVTTVPQADVLQVGVFRQETPAPPITTREGDELYLTLTNVGTFIRPDLFDPHTVHYHGFPNSSAIFDGLPESTISVGQQSSLTYYYKNMEPGTYMYHCHVEATEHMQMGMLGSLHVQPLQNGTSLGNCSGGPCTQFVYNDGDGSTGYDVEFSLMLSGFDDVFHQASFDVQPLPFSAMRDTYLMINGRGYPDTANPGVINAPSSTHPIGSQQVNSLVTASSGQRILLRLINLGVVSQYTVTALGLPMKIVGHGAKQLKGTVLQDHRFLTTGPDLSHGTNTITLGGGESADVMIDTRGPDGIAGNSDDIAPGTYFLYATNMNLLSNNDSEGGMMTEIVIN